MKTDRDDRKRPTPMRLFAIFFRISAVTVGGGYAMVPVIGSALEKRGWFTETEYYDLFSEAQAFPGPLAFNTAIFAGRRLAGARGAAAGALGVLLPPFGVIVVLSALLSRYGEAPAIKAFLEGAGATVPGLVAAMIWRVSKQRKWTAARAAATACLAAGLVLLPGVTIPVFFAGIGLAYVVEAKWGS